MQWRRYRSALVVFAKWLLGVSDEMTNFDDAPTTEFTHDEATTLFWREASDEWAQRDNDETAAATPRAKERR